MRHCAKGGGWTQRKILRDLFHQQLEEQSSQANSLQGSGPANRRFARGERPRHDAEPEAGLLREGWMPGRSNHGGIDLKDSNTVPVPAFPLKWKGQSK
jgi:hypothetical protein